MSFRNLVGRFRKNPQVIRALFHLHNYGIDENVAEIDKGENSSMARMYRHGLGNPGGRRMGEWILGDDGRPKMGNPAGYPVTQSCGCSIWRASIGWLCAARPQHGSQHCPQHSLNTVHSCCHRRDVTSGGVLLRMRCSFFSFCISSCTYCGGWGYSLRPRHFFCVSWRFLFHFVSSILYVSPECCFGVIGWRQLRKAPCSGDASGRLVLCMGLFGTALNRVSE